MGHLSNLTREEKIILDEVKKNDYIRSKFYFTGETALSSYYLSHRNSGDLGFFKEKAKEVGGKYII